MPANPQTANGFTETKEVPTGRSARKVSDDLWELLAASAKRSTAWVKTAPAAEIDELKKDLGTAAVRAKYKVTINTEKGDNGAVKLKFSAVAKPADTPAETPADATASA